MIAIDPPEVTCEDDTIDGRDLQNRIEWLRVELAPGGDLASIHTDERITRSAKRELAQLRELRNQLDARLLPGVTLIRDGWFESYAREWAVGNRRVADDALWPCDHLDWAAAAAELKLDYSSVTFGDVTFWVVPGD